MFDQDRRRAVYALRFTPYPGLVVHTRKPGFRALERLVRAVSVLGSDLDGEGASASERIRAWGALHRAFAESLVGWTLADRGRPVPATLAGVLAQDPDFLLEIGRTWYRVVALAEQASAPAPVEPVTEDVSLPNPDDDPDSDPDGEPGVDEEWLSQLPVKDMPLPAPEPVAVPA